MADDIAPPPSVESSNTVHAPILWRHLWNDHLLSIRIARDADYRFVPGQFARIGLADANGEATWRAYSIVSAPHEPFLEFFLVVLPEGKFSARVAKLDVGQTIMLEKPAQGFLTLERFKDGRDLWLIGTGTGLAPYISMLREPSTWTRFSHIVVALSVREARDLAYIAEIEALAASHTAGEAKLSFVTSLTRDEVSGDTSASALHGRLTTLTETGELERHAGVPFDLNRSRFMLCGNPEMVEAMRAILKSRGFAMNRKLTPGHIIVENYW
jgi:ferredoxin/flavodoxin---NADP+ reductase